MIGNRFYTWFKNYYQWVGGAFSETLLLPLVRATAGLRAGAIRYDETTDTVETYDGENWNAIPSTASFVPNTRTITINGTTFDLSTNRIYNVGTVTSVGLSMPSAFNVSGSPLTGSGTLAVTAAGSAAQYVRGDGVLANFPTSQGGGSSVSYYLNGSVSQGAFSGNSYKEMSRIPVLGSGTDVSIGSNGYIEQFITDAGDPGLLQIPAGNWNFELYFSASSGGGNPSFYVELAVWDGVNINTIATSAATPKPITSGTTIDAYFTTLAVPETTLTIDSRLAIRIYVNHSGRTITLHTENNHLCQIITTFSTGMKALNGLTEQVQYFQTGTNGDNFNIESSGSIHKFNIPTASNFNRGLLSSADWSIFNGKQAEIVLTTNGNSGASTINGASLNIPQYTLAGLGGVPLTRSITINDQTFNLDANRSWIVGNVRTDGNYPNPSWITDLSWNKIIDRPTTLAGYGIIDAVPSNRKITINGAEFDLSTDRSYSVGTVTSVGLSSSTSGVTITNTPISTSGAISLAIATANASQQGLLSNSDWITFNNKQNAITLTTNGTSGAASFISSVLNIPQYQAQGNYITSLTGEATATGPGAASVTLSTTAVTGKLLTGLNLTGGGTIAATDSILDAFGKVQNQISAMMGGVTFQGTWNASTNTPTLTSSVGTKGYYYIVDVSGTTSLNGISDWRVGDWAIFNGTTWDKVDNTDAVSSVNGFTGAVSLTTSHITEGTRLYYTDTRARAAISLTTTGNSGAATYGTLSGVLNIPEYTLTGLGGVPSTRQLTINGTAFDLSANRTWSVGTVTSVGLSTTTTGVTIGNTPVTGSGTITVNIATASGSQNGLLSSTDWTTFNNKQNALTNPITGTGTTGQVAYFNGTTSITSESNLFWDAANDRLGIGTTSPAQRLSIFSGAGVASFISTCGNNNVQGTSDVVIGQNSDDGGYFWNRKSSFLSFGTNNTERMRLDSAGNLGLGVTPSAWVAGISVIDIGARGTVYTGSVSNGSAYNAYVGSLGWQYKQSAEASRYEQNSGTHAWYTAPSGTAGNAISFTQAMTLNASGNLLLGTTSDPGYGRQTASIYNANGGIVQVAGSSTTALFYVFQPSNIAIAGTTTNDPFAFITNNTERMRISSGGSLVIFGSNSSSTPFALGSSTPKFQLMNGGVYGLAGDVLTNGNSYLQSQRTDGNTATYNLLLQPLGGNVGIGTASPSNKLTIENAAAGGATWTDNQISIVRDFGSTTRAQNGDLIGKLTIEGKWAGSIADAGVQIRAYATNSNSNYPASDMLFYTSAANSTATERMRITSGGEVYIAGTTDQGAYNLQVNGTGVWGAGAYVNGSDERLKEEIQEIEKGLEYINKVKAVKFKYKSDYSKDRNVHTGFIAQQLQSVFAEEDYLGGMVQEGAHLNVAYQNIIPILVKSIQELTAEIERLKN